MDAGHRFPLAGTSILQEPFFSSTGGKNSSSGMIIGIDLGTTNSVAAYLTADGPQLILNSLGEALTPSVVGIDDSGAVLVGRAARELQVVHPERCASVFKRYMGSDWSIELAGRKFTPETLSGLVLRSLKEDAEHQLGQPVTAAVVTVPAYFNEPQRKATLNAGRIAGLKVERILNEPTAAALAYGMHSMQDEKVLAVVDLGGGTFDVSIVDLFAGALEVRASAGECFLGGEDFTRTLAARVLAARGIVFEAAEFESPLLVARMIQQCELAKCQLSRQTSVSVRLADSQGNLTSESPVEEVTREQFHQWTEPILNRVELPIRRALGDARLKPGDVDEVILVGGATRMPAFVARAWKILGREPHCHLDPDEVVARGAAVQAGLIGRDASVSDMVVTDVAPFTLGIEVSKQLGLEQRGGYLLPIIHRNTTIPASRVERVQTIQPNQTQVIVKVFQGENRRSEQNLLLGEFAVVGIQPGPPGQALDIRFTYDLNGVLEVEATVVATKRVISHVITRLTRNLSDAEIAKAVQAIQQLKTHPREEAANRLTLRRAERIYCEVSPLEQQQLSYLIDAFEGALNLGNKPQIESCREALEEYLDHFELGYDSYREPDGDDDA
jgi:molecular chaperone HscC